MENPTEYVKTFESWFSSTKTNMTDLLDFLREWECVDSLVWEKQEKDDNLTKTMKLLAKQGKLKWEDCYIAIPNDPHKFEIGANKIDKKFIKTNQNGYYILEGGMALVDMGYMMTKFDVKHYNPNARKFRGARSRGAF